MKVGFIGLGTMGRHMAANLQKAGHEVVVHDVRREAAESHIKAGAKWADSPRAVAEASEVIFASLPEPKDVESVALDEKNGLLSGMTAGKAFFDLSTNSPTVVRRLYAIFKSRGVHMLDSPVSGGPRGAESRKLALWIGGDEEVFRKFKSVIDAIGDQPYYVGPIGAGSIAKLVHNCAGYMIQTALAEVFTMGVKAGVDPLAIFKAVRQGARGRARTFDPLGDQLLAGQVRSAGLRAAPGPQGRLAGCRARPREQGADADGQHDARGDDRGAQSRLGRARLARGDAAAGGAGRRGDQGAGGAPSRRYSTATRADVTAAKRLASFVVGLDLAKIPGPVVATATLLALDTLGNALAAASRRLRPRGAWRGRASGRAAGEHADRQQARGSARRTPCSPTPRSPTGSISTTRARTRSCTPAASPSPPRWPSARRSAPPGAPCSRR